MLLVIKNCLESLITLLEKIQKTKVLPGYLSEIMNYIICSAKLFHALSFPPELVQYYSSKVFPLVLSLFLVPMVSIR